MGIIETICIVTGAVATVLGSVWFIINKAQKMAVNNYRLDEVEHNSKVLTSGMAEVKSDVGILKSDVSTLRSDTTDMKSDVSAIKAVLMQRHPKFTVMMAQKKSPRILNDTGKWVFSQINGAQFLRDNKKFLFDKIDKMSPKTALDVENAAKFACMGYTDNDIFNDIKLYVYNAPAIKVKNMEGKEISYDLSLDDVCYTLSTTLRDMYLREHGEIPQ